MSDLTNNDVNLSEILFKPKHDYIETSLISNSGCELPPEPNDSFFQGSYFRSLWYRPLHLYTWTELGANNLDVEEALANIIMSQNMRTRPTCFDTVEQYGSGNWIYEFCTIGQKRLNLGQEKQEQGDLAEASHQFRMASRYFAIAAFPNLKGDILATQASLMCRLAYRKIFNEPSKYGFYSEETFKVRGEEVTGYLHSPDNTSLHPCVVMVNTYSTTATDHFRLFDMYLRPLGIALFIVDMPGMGSAGDIQLDEKSSDILEAAVEHLNSNVKFIDGSSLGAIGMRLSANAVVRLSIMNKDLFKAIALVSPFIHSSFINQDLLNALPLSTRSSIANRLNLDASHWDTIVPQLQILSLKKQGLITYSSKVETPCLNICLPFEAQFSDDKELVDNLYPNHETHVFKKVRVADYTNSIYSLFGEFFKKNLL